MEIWVAHDLFVEINILLPHDLGPKGFHSGRDKSD
jgi:hypothetical protein